MRRRVDLRWRFRPEELERLRQEVLARPAGGFATTFEVVNETTLAGIETRPADWLARFDRESHTYFDALAA